MSYGSTFVQPDPSGKLSSRLSRAQFHRSDSERPHRLVHYDKAFDVSMSRVTDTGPDRSAVRDSMIAYSNKMKSLHDARRASGTNQGDPLFVKAKRIPKHPVRPPKKRRPMSFDELLGRDRESPRDRGKGGKPRPHSDKHKPLHASHDDGAPELPILKDRLRNPGYNVHMSLVSASDLYDIVDFSLRSKHSKAESLQLRHLEAAETGRPHRRRDKARDRGGEEVARSDTSCFQKTRASMKVTLKDANELSDEDLVPSSAYYEQVFSLEKTDVKSSKLPSINNEIFKRRPNRVKRMKLQDPMLEDIPEDASIHSGEVNSSSHIENTRRVSSPPPPKHSPRSLELVNKHPLDVILEQSERNTRNEASTRNLQSEVTYHEDSSVKSDAASLYRNVLPRLADTKTTKKVLLRDDGDVRIEVTQCPPKQELGNTKLRAQKRIKKLIFLRDGSR